MSQNPNPQASYGQEHLHVFAALAHPFEGDEVKVRQQGGRHLHYITARTAMNRLDNVVGPANWWDCYIPNENSVLCQLSIRLPDGTVITKQDAGGYAGMSDQGDDDKSGYSDAFKRAAVKFGVGRFYLDSPVRYHPVPGFPGYMVGDDASVWSQWERGRWKRRRASWRRLKTPLDNHGYPQVNLSQPGGRKQHFRLHRLVLLCFEGHLPEGQLSRHLNGDRGDNRLGNLMYGTDFENAGDALLHGTAVRGERCPAAKLTEQEVAEIRRLVNQGIPQKQLAARFGVSRPTVSEIVSGKTWAIDQEAN